MKSKRKSLPIITLLVCLMLFFIFTYYVSANIVGLTVTACDVSGCSASELNNLNDVSGMDLAKTVAGITDMSDPGGSGTINSVTFYVRHSGGATISDYLQDSCGDETTGPGFYNKTDGITKYCACPQNSIPNVNSWTTHSCVPTACDWTWAKLADLEIHLCNDDGSGPDTAYIDYINVTIDYDPAADNPPKWYDAQANESTPNPGDTVLHSVNWTDDTTMSFATLEVNGTGASCNTLGNVTNTTLSQASEWANLTWTVPGVCEGKVIGWRQYANDSSNKWNTSDTLTYTVQNVSPTVSNTGVNDTEVNKNEAICINATATDVGVGIDDVWTMVTYPNGTEVNATMSDTGPSCAGNGDDWYGVNFNVGNTGGTLYVNTSYANDTLGNEDFESPFPDVAVTVVNNVSFNLTFLNGSGVISSPTGTQGLDQNITADNGSHKYADPCLNNEPECQTSSLGILRFNNTGDVATNWSVRLNQSLPSSIVLWGSKDSDPDTNIQLISDTAWTVINESVCINCEEEFWVWANFTDAAVADEITLRLNNTANDT